MSLRKKQSEFMQALGVLIEAAYALGYELTPGDTYSARRERPASSYHHKGLAIDLNLFLDGNYSRKASDHQQLGEIWEALGGTWGGRFSKRDGNHYSWGEGSKK